MIYELNFTCETDAQDVIEDKLPEDMTLSDCDDESFNASLYDGRKMIEDRLKDLKSKYSFMESYQIDDYDYSRGELTIYGSFETEELPSNLELFKDTITNVIEDIIYPVYTTYWTLYSQATYWEPAEYEDHNVSSKACFYNIKNIEIKEYND